MRVASIRTTAFFFDKNVEVCEKISQALAPFHVIARGWAGPSLLAMVLFEKFGQHQPLNREAERYARKACRSAYRPRPIRSAIFGGN